MVTTYCSFFHLYTTHYTWPVLRKHFLEEMFCKSNQISENCLYSVCRNQTSMYNSLQTANVYDMLFILSFVHDLLFMVQYMRVGGLFSGVVIVDSKSCPNDEMNMIVIIACIQIHLLKYSLNFGRKTSS